MADEQQTTPSIETTTPEPLGNSAEARTETGEIKDQSAAPSLTSEAKPEEAKTEAPAEGEAKTEEKPAGPPEKYEFKAPEGIELDAKAIEAAEPIFRELGLNNDQAQKLVDLYSTQTKAAADAPMKAFMDLQDGWKKEVIADRTIGNGKDGLAPAVSKAIGSAINGLGAEQAAAFRDVLDKTGLGNNPTFIRGLYAMVKDIGEGTHVRGAAPSPEGQRASPGAKSLAERVYPNLPSASRG